MLEHTYREIVLRNGKREKIKLAVDFEDPDYSLLGIFLATEAGTFHREIAEELDAILQGEKETGEFLNAAIIDAARRGVDLVVGCGPLARHIAEGAKAQGASTLYFAEKAELLPAIGDVIRDGDCVLVKASRGMAFEEIVTRLTGENKA